MISLSLEAKEQLSRSVLTLANTVPIKLHGYNYSAFSCRRVLLCYCASEKGPRRKAVGVQKLPVKDWRHMRQSTRTKRQKEQCCPTCLVGPK
ncbi:hypothetical protein DPEC_G00161920 [Dallia pectoralis]|uniref:Uncharacterized protein n=1 Tax=Dallia pectoralis TaxID=75939 RepID=A0ACC2GGE2_DALPE|nr:hypothetical protein DPEC_G00161920 [Dallia pectoralis]